jgi:hypothetical protein
MGSNANTKIMKDGEFVAAKYKPKYKKDVRLTFLIIREEFAKKKILDDNIIPILK